MVNLLHFEAPIVAALERQSDEDAVIHRWTWPASGHQGHTLLEEGAK